MLALPRLAATLQAEPSAFYIPAASQCSCHPPAGAEDHWAGDLSTVPAAGAVPHTTVLPQACISHRRVWPDSPTPRQPVLGHRRAGVSSLEEKKKRLNLISYNIWILLLFFSPESWSLLVSMPLSIIFLMCFLWYFLCVSVSSPSSFSPSLTLELLYQLYSAF